jgi:hypothetical protein
MCSSKMGSSVFLTTRVSLMRTPLSSMRAFGFESRSRPAGFSRPLTWWIVRRTTPERVSGSGSGLPSAPTLGLRTG